MFDFIIIFFYRLFCKFPNGDEDGWAVLMLYFVLALFLVDMYSIADCVFNHQFTNYVSGLPKFKQTLLHGGIAVLTYIPFNACFFIDDKILRLLERYRKIPDNEILTTKNSLIIVSIFACEIGWLVFARTMFY